MSVCVHVGGREEQRVVKRKRKRKKKEKEKES